MKMRQGLFRRRVFFLCFITSFYHSSYSRDSNSACSRTNTHIMYKRETGLQLQRILYYYVPTYIMRIYIHLCVNTIKFHNI